jgi:hypothetical protein
MVSMVSMVQTEVSHRMIWLDYGILGVYYGISCLHSLSMLYYDSTHREVERGDVQLRGRLYMLEGRIKRAWG